MATGNVPLHERSQAGRAPALFYLASTMLVVALLLGGSGDYYTLITLTIEMLALLVLWSVAVRRTSTPPPPLGLLPRIIVIGSIALILAQLVPLPAQLWHLLPGREREWQLLDLAGLGHDWRPLSLDPAASVSTALQILPGLAAFFAVLHLGERDRRTLLVILVAAGLLSALLGALQKTGGPVSPFILFDTPHRDNSPGLFVNRNHQATFLLTTMLMTAGTARSFITAGADRLLLRLIATGAIIFLAAATVITSSRTGFALLAPALAAALLILFPVKVKWPVAAAIAAAGSVLLLFVARSDAVDIVLERFSESDERPLYWRDTITGIAHHWPFGSGLGTFADVYASIQSVEAVGIQYVNNAHNDYLELALEAGLPAVVLIGLFLLWCLVAGRRLATRAAVTGQAPLGAACLAAIAVILLHSIVDYPLRMLSIMCTFGLLAGLLLTVTAPVAGRPRKTRRSPGREG